MFLIDSNEIILSQNVYSFFIVLFDWAWALVGGVLLHELADSLLCLHNMFLRQSFPVSLQIFIQESLMDISSSAAKSSK